MTRPLLVLMLLAAAASSQAQAPVRAIPARRPALTTIAARKISPGAVAARRKTTARGRRRAAQSPAATPAPTGFARWEPEIHAFEAADLKAPPKPGGIVFVGSSSIRMWKTLDSDFPDAEALNRGFGGSVIADSTHFAGRIITKYHPRQVVLYAGDNDLAAGRTAREVLLDFHAFVRRVRHDLPGVPIAFIAIKPSPSREKLLDAVRDANRRVRNYAWLHDDIAFIDICTPMLGPDGKPRPELFAADMLHLNPEGYHLWRGIVAPHLRPAAR